MNVKVGERCPNLEISKWVQGASTNIDNEIGNVIIVEVFQVNCPGCFLYAIPEAIDIYKKYSHQGLRILGIATAFEDFDKNTLGNLELLAEKGEVIGETFSALSAHGKLRDGSKLLYNIPFPLGMDRLEKRSTAPNDAEILGFIRQEIPDFEAQPAAIQERLKVQVRTYFKAKRYSAGTFDKFSLKGTPSTIIVDRNGILQEVSFGRTGHLDETVKKLI